MRRIGERQQPAALPPGGAGLIRPFARLIGPAVRGSEPRERIEHVGIAASFGELAIAPLGLAAISLERVLLSDVSLAEPVALEDPFCCTCPAAGCVPITFRQRGRCALQRKRGESLRRMTGLA